MCRMHGYSLLELLVTLAVLSTVLAIAVPTLGQWRESVQGDVVIRQAQQMIFAARHKAVTREVVVTLCGSSHTAGCDGQWSAGILLFTDANRNRQVDGTDRVIQFFTDIPKGSQLHWRAAFGRDYMQFLPHGRTAFTGSLIYCPKDSDLRQARLLIMNIAGRPRTGIDSDGDGIEEMSNGDPLPCPS